MIRNLFLFLCCSSIISCDASDIQKTQIELSGTYRYREILAAGDHPLRIDIVMNGGRNQRFTITNSDPSFGVGVTGVIEGGTNRIQVTFTEMLNGWPVILSQQDQIFIANGTNVLIDVEHQSRQFDNDFDGASNVEERRNNTCVWFANESCLTDGGIDFPPNGDLTLPEEDVLIHDGYGQEGLNVPASEINNGVETIYETDFTNGTSEWYSPSGSAITSPNNDMCVSVGNGHVGLQFNIAILESQLQMEAGSYIIQYDVKVNRQAPVATNTNPLPLNFYHYVQGTREWQTHTVKFENAVPETDNLELQLQGVISSVETTVYCFDNIKVVKV